MRVAASSQKRSQWTYHCLFIKFLCATYVFRANLWGLSFNEAAILYWKYSTTGACCGSKQLSSSCCPQGVLANRRAEKICLLFEMNWYVLSNIVRWCLCLCQHYLRIDFNKHFLLTLRPLGKMYWDSLVFDLHKVFLEWKLSLKLSWRAVQRVFTWIKNLMKRNIPFFGGFNTHLSKVLQSTY